MTPAGFPGFAAAGEGVFVRRGFESEARAWRAALDAPAPAREPGSAGRGGARALPIAPGGRAWLKIYRHGGLLGRLLGEVYWDHPSRPLRELAATEAARACGVVAPEVLAAIVLPVGRPFTGFYRAALVTREIAGRRSLADALRSDPDERERADRIGRCWDVLRRLHRCGIRHRDANATNFLCGAAGEEPALIDFDGAVVGTAPVGRIGRSFARRRLARSIGKLGLAGFDRGRVATLLDAREASA